MNANPLPEPVEGSGLVASTGSATAPPVIPSIARDLLLSPPSGVAGAAASHWLRMSSGSVHSEPLRHRRSPVARTVADQMLRLRLSMTDEYQGSGDGILPAPSPHSCLVPLLSQLRRRLAAIPARPVATRNIVAGSGTVSPGGPLRSRTSQVSER